MTRTVVGAVLVSCTMLLGVAACRGERAEPLPQVMVTDSAGRLQVRLGDLDDITTSPWQVEEVYDTWSGATPIEFFRVTAARFLADGSLAVANSGTQEILFLDAAGTLRHRIGGAGEGPGEFRDVSVLNVNRAGDLVAYDRRLGRLTVIGPDGDLLEIRRFAPPNRVVDLLPLAILDGHRILAVYGGQRIFAAGGERRDSTPLFVFDSAGNALDTLGVWPAQEWSYISFSQGSARREVGFGRTLVHAGRNGYSVLGSTDSLDLTVFDRTARAVMRIAGGGPNDPVGAAELERWRADQREQMSAAPEELRRALSQTPHRETYPAFGALLLDDARRLWIGSYVRPGQTRRHWIVIRADGQLDGTLSLPADARLLDVAGDRLALLRRTDLDEEYVAVLRLVRAS